MRFGISISGLIQEPQGGDAGRRLEEVVAWVQLARDLGYDYLYTGQHYLTAPYQSFQPVPLLARLAPESGDMGLVATLLLSVLQPVELAESLATLDAISGGRLVINAARGYRAEEFAAFGVEEGQAAGRLAEAITCLTRLWTESSVDFEGRYFRLSGARLGLRPRQQPHPPIWYAANADAAVRRAARMGLRWSINPHADRPTVERQARLYRQEAAAAGHDPERPLTMYRELYCAPTTEAAWREVAPYLTTKYQTYAGWGQARVLPDRDDFTAELRMLARDRFIIGDPATCAAEIATYARVGIDHFHFRMAWPGMPLELARRSLKLVAERVLPGFRR